MGKERDEWIAARAYELWEQAGRPDGQDHEHWSQASSEWEIRQQGQQSKSSWDDEEY